MESLTQTWLALHDPNKIIAARDTYIRQIETDSDKIQRFLQDEGFWKLYFREYFTAHTDRVFHKSPLKQEKIYERVCVLAYNYYGFKVFDTQTQVASMETRLKYAIQFQLEKVIESLKDEITEPISMYNILAFAEEKKNIPALKMLFKTYYPSLESHPRWSTKATNNVLIKCLILLDDLESAYPWFYAFLQAESHRGNCDEIYSLHKYAIIHGTVTSIIHIHMNTTIPIPICPENENFLKIAAEHGKLEHINYLNANVHVEDTNAHERTRWISNILEALNTASIRSELKICDALKKWLFKLDPDSIYALDPSLFQNSSLTLKESESDKVSQDVLSMVSSDLFDYICHQLDDPNDIIHARYAFFHQIAHSKTNMQDYLKDEAYWTGYFENKFTAHINRRFSCKTTCSFAAHYFNFDNPFTLMPKGRQFPVPIWKRIMIAIQYNHEKVIETLFPKLENKRDLLKIADSFFRMNNTNALSSFFDYYFDSLKNLDLTKGEQCNLTLCAIKIDRFKEYKEFYEPIKNLDLFSIDGYPLLHGAAMHGTVSTIDEMIQMGTDPAQQSKDGLSLIHTATEYGKLEIVKYLIENNHDINKRTENEIGETPLHIAIQKGLEDIATLLINSGADLDIRNDNDETLLLLAAGMKQLEIMEKLIEKGAAVSRPATLLFTPLHFAINHEFTVGALLLIEKGADVNAQAIRGITPLHYAVTYYQLAVAEKLLEKGADTTIVDANQFTAQDYLDQMEDAKEMKELFRNHEHKKLSNIDDREIKKPRI